MMQVIVKQAGFSLLEVLIAMIVLSIGLLGHSKIQALNVRAGTDAHLRTEATFLVNDMIEHMRANRPSASATNDYYATIDYSSIDCTGSPAKICSEGTAGSASDCSSSEMADEDAFNWFCEVTATLPNGNATVTSAAGVYSVQVSWDGLDESGNVQNLVVSTDFIP